MPASGSAAAIKRLPSIEAKKNGWLRRCSSICAAKCLWLKCANSCAAFVLLVSLLGSCLQRISTKRDRFRIGYPAGFGEGVCLGERERERSLSCRSGSPREVAENTLYAKNVNPSRHFSVRSAVVHGPQNLANDNDGERVMSVNKRFSSTKNNLVPNTRD